MLSFIFLGFAFAESLPAPDFTVGAAPEGRRRIDESKYFTGADANYVCFDTAVEHTWVEYWQTSGRIDFTAPTLDTSLKLVIKKKAGKSGDITKIHCHADDASCKAEVVGDDVVYSPAAWAGYSKAFAYYINFGSGATDMDFNNDVEIFYCYKPALIHFDAKNDLKGTLANVAGFLAQAAWESGDFLYCEEQMHVSETDDDLPKEIVVKFDNGSTYTITPDNAGCTQRSDDAALYHELTQDHRKCAVTTDMKVGDNKAKVGDVTTGTNLFCKEGSEAEKCCWWGRGALQTTGPSNFGAFQNDVVDRNSVYAKASLDLCGNPSLLCSDDYKDLRWESALYYWVASVQNDACFDPALKKYAEAFDVDAVSGSCKAFAAGIGGMVNQGEWSKHAHGEDGRIERFTSLVTGLKDAMDLYESADHVNEALPAGNDCTGSDEVDWIFWKAGLESLAKIDVKGSAYAWSSFCSSLAKMIPAQ